MKGLLRRLRLTLPAIFTLLVGCSTPEATDDTRPRFTPTEVIDLGASVTEDLPERVWGKALLKQRNYNRGNSFDVIKWTAVGKSGTVNGSNAYYTLFNHGGPHVDAPSHMGMGDGVDSYPVEAFSGPLKVFDVSGHSVGRSVPPDIFKGRVEKGDVVLILTRYTPPQTDDALPKVITLTREASEFLATLPVRAYGTDAWSVDALEARTLPSIHESFLARGIPVYEQLFNVDRLLGKGEMFFVGVPLNIKAGDGMMVRPVVFVY